MNQTPLLFCCLSTFCAIILRWILLLVNIISKKLASPLLATCNLAKLLIQPVDDVGLDPVGIFFE